MYGKIYSHANEVDRDFIASIEDHALFSGFLRSNFPRLMSYTRAF
jgi:hypothetical protein